MSIKSIQLHNFQSHASTVIEFDNGVNALVGLSDHGKSSIMRAFFWIINNRPMGNDYLSHWADECFATMTVDNDIEITRGIDKEGKNFYALQIPGQKRQEFRAFKQEVPLEIQRALNISDINIQNQGDLPYLLSTSPGEVAQILNRIVHLDIIDIATSNVRKMKDSVNRDLTYAKKQVDELTKQYTHYQYLENMESDVLVLEQLLSHKKEIAGQISRLELLLGSIREKQETLKQFLHIQKVEDDLGQVFQLKVEKDRNLQRLKDLKSILQQIREKQESLKRLHAETKQLEEEFHKLMPKECPLCGK